MTSLPSGTVTFLFADVEGSTRLARELGDEWQTVLADIRRLLRDAVSGAEGHEVDCRGDELLAGSSRRLRPRRRRPRRSGDWAAIPGPRPCASGSACTPVPRRSARTATWASTSTAPTGSPTAVTVARSSRPRPRRRALAPARELRDLGLWALPDLPDPERIFQLDEPGLAGDFPPLRARPGATPVRVVLADDSVLLREGIASLLTGKGSTSSARAALPTTCC